MASSSNFRSDVNFQALFKKLGHSLEEIRVRALESLLSKLEHKLICDADLVNERHLIIRLLEWFNFPNCTKQKDVLLLLQRLSQHSGAAEILQDIGGIEFLSKLRGDMASALQTIVDQILENTMKLPDTKIEDHAPQCIYHGREDQNDEAQCMKPVAINFSDSRDQMRAGPPQSSHVSDTPHITTGQEGLGYFQKQHMIHAPTAANAGTSQLPENTVDGSSESFLMTFFPWLALTSTDRHVIQSTTTSLQSRESHLLASSCEFLSDVVFQDFPAEIFLQRPNIVKNLLSILGVPPVSNTQLTVSAAKTLGDLTSSIRARMHYYQDPTLCTPKQDFCMATGAAYSMSPSSNSGQSNGSRQSGLDLNLNDTRPRGDGRDYDSSTSSNNSRASSVGLGNNVTIPEDTDIDDAPTLQCVQLSIPQFSVLVLEKALPLLRTNDEQVIIHVLYLIQEVFGILATVVMPSVWEDVTSAGREIVEKLAGCLETIADLLEYHHHSNKDTNAEKDGVEEHRLAYIGVVCLLNKFVKFFVPYRKARVLLPERIIAAISTLIFDEALSHSFSDVQINLLTVLQHVDHDRYTVFVDAAKVAQSMHKSCKFLTLCQHEAYKGSVDLASPAEESLVSLPYHMHLSLVSEFVKLMSSVCARPVSQNEEVQLRCRQVFLKYLAHPLVSVRNQTYCTVLQVVKGSLSVNEAADPKSRTCYLVRFLFDRDVLYEIIVFGLADRDQKVSKLANELMFHLLDSKLLMSEDLWKEFMSALLKSLPALQSYCDVESPLGKCALRMTDPNLKEDGGLPNAEKLRGTLRCMFSSDIRTRAEALKRIAWFLSNETDSCYKLPIFSNLDVSHLTNVFVMETQRCMDEDMGRSVFQVDGMKKVMDIFQSSAVDASVKKSAADQLAIILQDHNLHSSFRLAGGLELILNHIKKGITKQGENLEDENCQCYLPACVNILRNLLHYDYSLRHKLAYDSDIYLSVVRVAFLNQTDELTCYSCAHILCLLLFDEVAKFDIGGGVNPVVYFSLPSVLKKRYKLPIRVPGHHDNSPNQVASPADDDPLVQGPPAEMLKVAWNIAWHGDMQKLLGFIKKNDNELDKFTDFSPRLQLSITDRILLRTTHLTSGQKQAIYDISNATSHSMVSSALQRLLTYLVVAQEHPGSTSVFSLELFSNIARFLKITPTSTADESLLQEVLKFISMALRLVGPLPDNTLQCIGEILYQPSGSLISLLHRASIKGESRDVPENVNIKRTLDKELLSFIAAYNCKLPYIICRKLKIQQLRGDLAYQLTQRLNITDAPHFYNLASLEGTLQCLMHITARPGWSNESTDLEAVTLCTKVLNCLLEVISAFHIGRGGTSMSFMGKGVTKAATLCLRHLANEMACNIEEKDWAKNWCHNREKGQEVTSEFGLNWMLTLWTYRDSEVRAAGLGIAVALSSTEEGRIVLTSNCRHMPGGLWGMTLGILLDHMECSMVRQQAALLLVNLTSQAMPVANTDLDHKAWQGPVVTDPEFEVSLVGLEALLALLHHSHFYQEMLTVLSNFYAQPTIQPLSVLENIQGHSSMTTDSTLSSAGFGIDAQQHRSTPSTGSQKSPRDKRTGHLSHRSTSSSTRTQQSADRQDSSHSSGSDDTITHPQIEYQCISTPSLVSALCRLLRNLVILAPQDTFNSLKKDNYSQVLTSMLGTNLLEAYMIEMTEEDSSDQLELVFCDLLLMYSSILRLLQSCIVHDATIRLDLLANENFMRTVASLLTIRFEGSSDVDSCRQELWESTFTFLTALLQLQGGSALHSFTNAVQGLWFSFAETLQTVMEQRLYLNRDLYISALEFLSVLFCEEGRLQERQPDLAENTVTVTSLLNSSNKDESEDKDAGGMTPGCQICKAMVRVYEQSCLRSTDMNCKDRQLAVTALRSLLGICASAKNTALELGVVENILEHVKNVQTKLSMEALQTGTKTSGRKKDDALIQELVMNFDLLRNFLFQNMEAKMACFYSGLHNIVHKLWPWCLQEVTLMRATLTLLATYVAHCPTATSSLAYSSTSGPVSSTKNQQLNNNSLIHCLIRYAQKEGLDDQAQRFIFALLATLTLCSEGRNVIFKSNFLSGFLDLNPKKTKKSKKRFHQQMHWLDLYVNLSFSVEGQQMILKTGDSVSLLLEFVESASNLDIKLKALLILRNMSCHTSNKPKLLANENFLSMVLECLGNSAERMQALAASALWAMVYNNQKAKVMMKNANILPKLQSKIDFILDHGDSLTSQKCLEDLQSVVNAVTE